MLLLDQFPIIPEQILIWQGYQIHIKRLDLIHPTISGNKFYKLKYHLQHARQSHKNTLISFGGAYSNHIYALAHAGHQFHFKTIGYIRSEELKDKPLNPQLKIAQDLGMQLHFLSRVDYNRKHHADFLQALYHTYPDAWIIPEGGTHPLAIQGCQSILTEKDLDADLIACAVGTAGTFIGLILTCQKSQKPIQLLGFSALNGEKHHQALLQTIHQFTADVNPQNWQLFDDNPIDGFGGYAKVNAQLYDFIQTMQQDYQLPLEPIYTAKALYRLQHYLLQHQIDRHKKIIFIHTGGLNILQHSPILSPSQK